MSARRSMLAAVAIVVLGGLCARAAVLGTTGSVAFDADIALSQAPAPKRLTELGQELREALSAAPADPALHELHGIVELRAGEIQAAGNEFERALELRPVAPVTWANVAEQRYLAGDTGPVFRTALLNAARLGPNEPAVQAEVANLGLAMWDDLAIADRAAVESMVAAGVRRSPREFLQIAGRRGRLMVACRHFVVPPRQADMEWTRTCQGMEATS